MTTTTTNPASTGRAEHEGFSVALRAEWTKFCTVRGWLVAMALAGALCAAFTFLVANGNHQTFCTTAEVCTTGHPPVPTGPDGGAVADSYQYDSRSLTGDGTLTAHISSLTGLIYTGPADRAPTLAQTKPGLAAWSKAGILLTPSTKQGATYAAVMVTGGHGLRFQHDYSHDQPGEAAPLASASAPWLRLTRRGNTVTGLSSADGTSWHEIGTAHLPQLSATIDVGLFVTSPTTYQSGAAGVPTQATATFNHVAISGETTSAWKASAVGVSPQSFYPMLGAGTVQQTTAGVTITGSGDIAPAMPKIAGGSTPSQTILFGVLVALIVLIVVASGFVTGEYRRGLIRTTLAAIPRRRWVLAAKAIVIAGVAFAVGVLAAAAALPLGLHVLNTNGNYVFPTSAATQVRVIVSTGLLLALTAVGALALGTILRRAAAAVVAGLVVFVLPGLLGPDVLGPGRAAAGWLYEATPAAAFASLGALPRSPLVDYPFTLANGYYPLSPWAGLAVLAAYVATALAAAAYLLRRRDA